MIDKDISRLSRLTAIMTLLLSKKSLSAHFIANKFEISVRTVYRDIKALEAAGLPIVSENKLGYSLMDDYKLPPIMFTQEEAISFLTAEKFMEKLTDKHTSIAFDSAIAKIKSVLKNADKKLLENLDQNIEVISNPYLIKQKNDNQFIPEILNSIVTKNVVSIEYEKVHTNEKTTRNIEPIGIYFSGSRWFLIAFCLLKNDYRNFRIDKILTLKQTNQKTEKQHPTLKKYLQQISASEKTLEKVVITMAVKDVHKLGEQKYYLGFVEEKFENEQVEMTFLTASLNGFAKAYLMYADFMKIKEPKKLKQIAKDLAKKIIKRL